MKKKQSRTALSLAFMMLALFATAQHWEGEYEPQSQTISKTYVWYYGGHKFVHTFTFRQSDYDYYRSLSKDLPYGAYCMEYEGHRYIARIAKELDDIAARRGYSGASLAGFLLSFVHSIPYKPDPPIRKGAGYPRFPIETIIEFGDCKSHAILGCSLFRALGFDVVLACMENAHHMATAIASDSSRFFFLHNGKRYAYMETVPCDLGIGNQPAEYHREIVGLIDVPQVALYLRHNVSPPVIGQKWDGWDREDYERIIDKQVSTYSFSISVTSDWHLTVVINGWVVIDI